MVNPQSILWLVLFVVVVIAGWIDWRGLIEKHFGNDPSKARIYIESGEQVEAVNGKLLYIDSKGLIYGYKWRKQRLSVCVPNDYKYYFLKGMRMIRVVAGYEAAAPWQEGEPLSKEGVFSVSALVYSHLLADLVKSVTVKKQVGLMWILIIGGIAVAGYFIYQFMTGGMAGGTVEPVVPPAPVSPDNVPVGYILSLMGVC